ncbi:acetylcholine receptor non-alpha chain-like, partial [Symsagittifera roscoffensis]|uniref:acetylcholine receptor non-alpha chain-like n=1 Tax=Symsagittifera roscoffensis TaxID=84072 RepID=UPI00307B5024
MGRISPFSREGSVSIRSENEQEQKVTTAVWQVRTWYDEFLSWNPEDFGNIRDIRVKKSRIWFPDLVVTNTIQVQEPDIKIKLNYTGELMWDSALVLETSCHINVKFFPYDHQFCQILI